MESCIYYDTKSERATNTTKTAGVTSKSKQEKKGDRMQERTQPKRKQLPIQERLQNIGESDNKKKNQPILGERTNEWVRGDGECGIDAQQNKTKNTFILTISTS